VSAGLRASGLHAGYGPTPVLFDVDVHVAPGEVVAVLGHNGAGKSTLLKTLFGLLVPTAGRIELDGVDVTAAPPHRRAVDGIAYSPQQDFVFRDLTVGANLELARFSTGRKGGAEHMERTADPLALFPILAERTGQLAGTLSGGQQRMLSIAIALLTAPSLILLDEPSLGIAPRLVREMMDVLRGLADEHGIGLLVAEQNVREATRLADRVSVLRRGAVVHHGPAAELLDGDARWELF
jgi:branched-chain amino acid transport system ATP-binding protein